MAITKPEKVPKSKITSLDIVSFNGGLDQRGETNITPNSFSASRNAMVNEQGLITHRFGLRKWLPDTVETVYQVFPALYGGVLYYVVANGSKIKYCESGDTVWTDAGGDAVTTTGVVNTFLRVLDKLLILNGTDKLGYLDLSDMTVYHYDAVTDPTNAPTAAATGITASGSFKVYYSISFNSTVGMTKNSPILTQAVSKSRDTWKVDGTEYLTVTRNNTAPTGAVSWNLYVSTAPSGAAIADIDMLPLATGLDLSILTFVDNGSLAVNLSAGTAPSDNSTEGPKAKYGVEIEGRPFLFGVTDDDYSLNIGGNGEHALDFSPTNGGYRLVLNQGTNYYPMSVVGFRNGQGIPSITVLFSNTQGLSKQSIVEQQTVTYGDISFIVWGSTEQNYGAAGVSSPYGVVNYKGALQFPSTDGFVKMDTQASIQNVLSTNKISNPIVNEVSTIKNNRLASVVGTAWGDRVLWSISARGFNTNNEIIVYDSTNKDLPIWYTFEIPSQWIGTISPSDEPAFIYVCQDNHIFRLQKSYVALDEDSSGVTAPFPVSVTTGIIGSNAAHTGYYAVVQVMFYLTNFIGSVDVTVRYRDQEGEWQVITDTITNGSYSQSSGGNWSSPGYSFKGDTDVLRWGETDVLADVENSQKDSIRYAIPIDDITNELRVTMAVNLTNSAFIGRSVSFEGQSLGISPDIR